MAKIGLNQGQVIVKDGKLLTDEQGVDCCCPPVEVEEACCLPNDGGCILAKPSDCVNIHGGTVPGQPTCTPDPCAPPPCNACEGINDCGTCGHPFNFVMSTDATIQLFCASPASVFPGPAIACSGDLANCVWSGTTGHRACQTTCDFPIDISNAYLCGAQISLNCPLDRWELLYQLEAVTFSQADCAGPPFQRCLGQMFATTPANGGQALQLGTYAAAVQNVSCFPSYTVNVSGTTITITQ